MTTDLDSPWKEALDAYLELCLALLFPAIHAAIDWSRGYESLDKELQQIAPESEVGRRYVDKLYKVWLTDGSVGWVLIHLEVQSQPERAFAERMFVYHYRSFDRFHRPVASLAVLADENPNWRPTHFTRETLGCTLTLTFPTVKLLDYRGQEETLATHPNLFAKVVLAHLKTQETRNDPAERHRWKSRLVRALYEQGLDKEDVRKLFRFIDWVMNLPPALEPLFWQEVEGIQEATKMPYISTPDRIAIRGALCKGIRTALELRFGKDGLRIMPEIEQIPLEKLDTILEAIKTAATPEELRKLWTTEQTDTADTTP